MKIHLIAIGGAVMHNLAMALHQNGNSITGSDDEINSPSRERLANLGILPSEMGWFPEKITTDLDLVILGMHAKSDNPELLKAQELGLNIQSFPEYIGTCYANKTRVVVAGSHGKTTTSAMIAHILKACKKDFDYLIGSNIAGFDTMVSITDAPIAIIEGDEYLSSALDRRSKFLHYFPDIAIITGIAWDHINVFPEFDQYVETFRLFIQSMQPNSHLFYYKNDDILEKLESNVPSNAFAHSYSAFPHIINKDGSLALLDSNNQAYNIHFFGKHNLENFHAAFLACRALNLSEIDILQAIATFEGSGKRMELIVENAHFISFLDFAHAPSKLKSTVEAVSARYPDFNTIAVYELHTFSSLNPRFLHQYAHTMDLANYKIVYFNEHTLKMKNQAAISTEQLKQAFGDENICVCTNKNELEDLLNKMDKHNSVLLWMSSGNFGGMDVKKLSNSFAKELIK